MKKRLEALLIVIILATLIWAVYSYTSEGLIYSLIKSDTTTVIQDISSYGKAAAIIFVLLIVLEVIFAPIPPLILYLAGGVMFGALLGGILALIGNVMGASIAFYIARRYGREFVEKQTPKKVRIKFDKFSAKYGTVAIFLLRVNPLTTTDLFSYLAGLSKMRYPEFILATALGLTPYIFIQSYLGDIFTGSSLLFNIFLIASLVYLIVFIIILITIKLSNKLNQKTL
ncbi:MAG: TVP38/TMEM64 family protein [archaeon]